MGPPPTLAHHMAVTHNLRVKVDVDRITKIQGVSTVCQQPHFCAGCNTHPRLFRNPRETTSMSFLNLGPSSVVTQLSMSTLLQASRLTLCLLFWVKICG